MKRLSPDLLRRMAEAVSAEDRDEMAIPSYLHRNPAMRWMAWRRVEVVAKWMEERGTLRPGGAVLDFGCGTGVLFETALGAFSTVYGADLVLTPARILTEERGYGDRVRLIEGRAVADTIPEGSLDLVVAAEVLEHVDPLEPTLALFHRLLKPDGRLLVSLPTEGALYKLGRRLAGFQGDYHHHDARSIHATIGRSGFDAERKHRIPLPGPAAIYWVMQYRKG